VKRGVLPAAYRLFVDRLGDRRSGRERRVGERRQRGSGDVVERIVVAVDGERRSGADRRAGVERRSLGSPALEVRRR
jgi:hypothetical protein